MIFHRGIYTTNLCTVYRLLKFISLILGDFAAFVVCFVVKLNIVGIFDGNRSLASAKQLQLVPQNLLHNYKNTCHIIYQY